MATQEVATGPMAVVDRMYQCFGTGDMETLKSEVFAPDIEWALPGHHPLSGVKRGRRRGAGVLRRADGSRGSTSTTSRSGRSATTGSSRRTAGTARSRGMDYLFPTCSVYTIRDGKIAHVQVYTADQHGVDDFFWKANALKPLPDRLA